VKILFIISLLLSNILIANETTPKASKSIQQSEIGLEAAKSLKNKYEAFIDTPPSNEKTRLAHQLKEDIETFEALYPHSPLLSSVLILLIEVDKYLASLTEH